MGKRFSRRDFLKNAAVTGIGLYGAAVLPIRGAEAAGSDSSKSRVVIINSPRVLVDPKTNQNTPMSLGMTTVGSTDGSIDQSVLNSMLGKGIQTFTGATSEAAAWKKLFKPSDVVGIKVNSLFVRGASTRPEVVASVIAGLKLAGVREENIIVWDRSDPELIRAEFRIDRNGPGVRCYGTEGDYESEPTKIGSFNGRMSKILTEKITAMINVPILKNHGLAGVTCAMKNHYGSHHNPGEHHGNNCDPFCAELNAVPAIKNKTRLIVCEALKPLANGGPGYRPEFVWEYKSLMIGSDPVAVDYVGSLIIEERRKEIGLPTLAEAGQPAKHIATAARMGLGTDDPAKMEIIRRTV